MQNTGPSKLKEAEAPLFSVIPSELNRDFLSHFAMTDFVTFHNARQVSRSWLKRVDTALRELIAKYFPHLKGKEEILSNPLTILDDEYYFFNKYFNIILAESLKSCYLDPKSYIHVNMDLILAGLSGKQDVIDTLADKQDAQHTLYALSLINQHPLPEELSEDALYLVQLKALIIAAMLGKIDFVESLGETFVPKKNGIYGIDLPKVLLDAAASTGSLVIVKHFTSKMDDSDENVCALSWALQLATHYNNLTTISFLLGLEQGRFGQDFKKFAFSGIATHHRISLKAVDLFLECNILTPAEALKEVSKYTRIRLVEHLLDSYTIPNSDKQDVIACLEERPNLEAKYRENAMDFYKRFNIPTNNQKDERLEKYKIIINLISESMHGSSEEDEVSSEPWCVEIIETPPPVFTPQHATTTNMQNPQAANPTQEATEEIEVDNAASLSKKKM